MSKKQELTAIRLRIETQQKAYRDKVLETHAVKATLRQLKEQERECERVINTSGVLLVKSRDVIGLRMVQEGKPLKVVAAAIGVKECHVASTMWAAWRNYFPAHYAKHWTDAAPKRKRWECDDRRPSAVLRAATPLPEQPEL